jgi:ATP-dependent DNA helicase RecG
MGFLLYGLALFLQRHPLAALRPSLLDPLFASVQSLKGVGPRFSKLIEKLAGPHVGDLLFHRPFRVIRRVSNPPVMRTEPGQAVILDVEVQGVFPGPRGRPSRVRVGNDSGFLDLVYFHARGDFLEKTFPVGEMLSVSGVMDDFQGKKQITHPDYVLPVARRDEIPAVEAVYPLITGLHAKSLHKAIQLALTKTPDLPEWIDPEFQKQKKWPAWKDAVLKLHAPQNDMDCVPSFPPRQRLAYDELLASQLAWALTREKQRTFKGRSLKGDGKLRAAVLKNLPFTPTNSQKEAFADIEKDMTSPNRMLRLLQGDVGSGKTLVALMAMLQAVEAGSQAALMAPTDLLAQQHAATVARLLGDLPIETVYLTGRINAPAKREALEKIASGKAKLIVGTHALFQEDVEFHDLALAIVDEQHRFGVHQRLALSSKGRLPDLLVLTATPIPRTLTITYYGDMDVSRLSEKPVGRLPIDTRTIPLARLAEVMEALTRKIKDGEKIYWVCPLIEESEVSDLAAATERFETLKKYLGASSVRLLHGRMKGPERDEAMKDFIDGVASVLVATTVVEVGVDVKEATLMVIEHAERFGLAQLHQLRGRVGRSDKPSSCLLLFQEPLGEMATSRLKMMRQTNDGFLIAEEDLRLRGPGEMLGTRQSGMPEFRLADLNAHHDLLLAARDDAKLIVSKDLDLNKPRGKALRHLLYLFQYDQAIKTLRSG